MHGMALETGRTPIATGLAAAASAAQTVSAAATDLSRHIGHILGPDGPARPALGRWFASQPVVRFISLSLLRRILVSNLIGLAILLLGILYISRHHEWLIIAKRESLKVQAEIIAAAIAANAREENGQLGIEIDKLPEAEGSRVPFRDDGFAALELSIRPERVTPILRRLIQPANIRARIYGRDKNLIVDSATLLSRGQVVRPEPTEASPSPKNFWTRFTYWFIDRELPVYREIGTANGSAYPEIGMALSGTTTAMLLLNEKGEQIVTVTAPIQRMKTVQGALMLSTRPGEIDEILSHERAVIAALALVSTLATIVVSLLLARTVADPMRRLSEAALHVSRNISAQRELPEYSDRKDEVGQMARAFAAMTAALFRRIEASEKFAADVAHELKNPLTAARSTAESLTYAKTPEQRDQLVTQIQSELKRLNRLITDIANASRLDAELARQQLKRIDVTHVIASISEIFRDMLSGENRSIALAIARTEPGAYSVNGDEGRLGQVLTNLIDNALSFSPEGGTVTIGLDATGDAVLITVADEGPGIPEDRLRIVFDRFYTDRPATESKRGKNSGLGLSISREIVRAHGGKIWAENRYAPGTAAGPGVKPIGACFLVRLPKAGGGALGRRG
jgi:two-component system, OmpR family, sensor histidine kinase ChvG